MYFRIIGTKFTCAVSGVQRLKTKVGVRKTI